MELKDVTCHDLLQIFSILPEIRFCCRFKPHLRLMDLLQDHKDRENTSVAAVQQALRRQAFQLSKKSMQWRSTQFLWNCIEGFEGSSTTVA